ncbi:hypothetical protein PF008_g23312 [Phytophthora fragariae]|uniref:Uncharacterized protein n=1 Tax=Phytophthora fragariae TaxID=53985 RepID=A0A6G0QS29_9STRA|nr:hypothetical protein PF008_g23312 [Phytophthora fragariae]
MSSAEEVSDEGLGGDPAHEETCVDADRPTEEESVVAGSPEAPVAAAEEGAVSSGRKDDLAQSDEVRDQEPMCKVGSQAEEVTRSPTQSATKQIPHEDGRASATAPLLIRYREASPTKPLTIRSQIQIQRLVGMSQKAERKCAITTEVP